MTEHLITRVAGVTYHLREALGCVRMAPEVPLAVRLVPEPDNPHDRLAVRVEASGDGAKWWHLGYIPRGYAPQVAAAIETHRLNTVRIIGIGTLREDENVPWMQLDVEMQTELPVGEGRA